MAFVNEKVSKEDGEKYGVFDLKRKYYKKDDMEFNINHVGSVSWSIDRERNLVCTNDSLSLT